ncbi:MAG: hypothetical protein HY689_13525 [Chloroflexi bacterium]|nr:hypothetical protein [Chloroflexota bacterium]
MTTIIQGNQTGAGSLAPARRVLIITDMLYQALNLQRFLADLGSEATLASEEDAGLAYLSLTNYDTVIIDVDLGYQVVRDLATRLRRDHPGSNVAIMVGWWDARAADMRAYSDLLIYKPVHPQQLREVLGYTRSS